MTLEQEIEKILLRHLDEPAYPGKVKYLSEIASELTTFVRERELRALDAYETALKAFIRKT